MLPTVGEFGDNQTKTVAFFRSSVSYWVICLRVYPFGGLVPVVICDFRFGTPHQVVEAEI